MFLCRSENDDKMNRFKFNIVERCWSVIMDMSLDWKCHSPQQLRKNEQVVIWARFCYAYNSLLHILNVCWKRFLHNAYDVVGSGLSTTKNNSSIIIIQLVFYLLLTCAPLISSMPMNRKKWITSTLLILFHFGCPHEGGYLCALFHAGFISIWCREIKMIVKFRWRKFIIHANSKLKCRRFWTTRKHHVHSHWPPM